MIAAHEQIERLIGAAQLDVRAERDGVVALGERVEELVEADRPPRRVAGGEILPLQDARDGQVRGLANDVLERQRAEPLRVEPHQGAAHVEHLPELGPVRLRVAADLVPGERPPRLRAAGGVADHPGEVPDDDDDLVSEVLEIAQLLEDHRVSQVQVGRGRVESQLDLERVAGPTGALELGPQLGVHDDLGGAPTDPGELLIHGKLGNVHACIIAIDGG